MTLLSPPPPLTSSERTWAGMVHVLSLLGGLGTGHLLGVGMMVAPVVGMILARKRYPFLQYHAQEALNFNITVFLLAILGTFFIQGMGWMIGDQGDPMEQATLTLSAMMLGVGLSVGWMVYTALAGWAGFRGRTFRHPLSWRMVGSPSKLVSQAPTKTSSEKHPPIRL